MKRRWLLGGVLGLVVIVSAALVILAPPERLPGQAIAVDPTGAAGDALDQLAELRDIHLTGAVGADNGQQLDVDVVVLDGDVQALVRDDAGGVAEFVVRDDEAAVRANAAWWRNTVPAFVQDYSDKWVKADDTAGFPVHDLADLAGDRLEKRLADPKADWSATPTLFSDGQPAMALSRGETGWTVYVSPTSPPRLLGIGGPVLGEPDRLTRGAKQTPSYPTGLLTTAKPDGPCRDRATRQLDDNAPAQADLPQPEVPSTDQRPALATDVSAPGGICYSAMCPFTVTVTNSGGTAAVGTLMMTSSSGGPMTVPVNIAPRGQFSTTYNVPNPAPPSPNGSVTVPIYVQAFAQVTALAGPDVDAGKRLNDRGVDANNPVPGEPSAVGPDVTGFLDRTTANVPVSGLTSQPDGDQVIETARDMVRDGISSRLFDTLLQLVNSPALRYGADVTRSPLPDLVRQAAVDSAPVDAQQARRMLDLLKRLTAGRPPPATPDLAPVHVEDGIVYDDENKLAYRPAVITGKGNAGQALVTALGDAAAELQNAPQGYAKVIELYVHGQSAGLGNLSRAQFRDQLRTAVHQGKRVKDVLVDSAGEPLVAAVSVLNTGSGQPDKGGTNGTYLFDAHDLASLGQTKAQNPPATPPASVTPHFTPWSRQHTLGGDTYETNAPQDSGGHRHGTGAPGKTEFPQAWTDADIEQAVLALVDRANQNAKNGTSHPPGTADATSISGPRDNKNQMRVSVWGWTYRGTVNGVEMEVTMLQDGTLMAYPTGNVADQNGTLVPSPNDPTRPDLPYVNPGGAGSPTKVPDAPKAQLPAPGGTPTQKVEVPLRPTGRTVWVRPTAPGGQGQWRFPGIAKPPSGPAVNVTVTTDQDGRNPKTDTAQATQAPPPAPTVC
jgi:hypothetical protein